MEGRRLLVVGIDPGVTTGYAVLDIEGNLLHVSSSKHLHLYKLISETIERGKSILVGTDKQNAPSLVTAFATKLGAVVASPPEDLKVAEKKESIRNFKYCDEHQGDAIASALFAYKSRKILLDRIDKFAEENKKDHIRDRIKELVITKRMSIRGATSLIEGKREEDVITKKAIVEKKFGEKDFLRIYHRMKSYENENMMLRDYNHRLRESLGSLEGMLLKEKEVDPRRQNTRDFRDKKIQYLQNLANGREKELHHLRSRLLRLNGIMANMNDYMVLKKLDNLGFGEFQFKNRLLNITKNDLLLVDEPNIISAEVVNILRDKVFLIVHKKQISGRNEKELPFIFMNSGELKIIEEKHFGFVDRKGFEIEKDKLNWAKKIVDDYRLEKRMERRF